MKDRPIIWPAEPQEQRAERVRRFEAFLFRLPADKPWELLVKPFTKTRTGRQNNAAWRAITQFADFCGYEPEELHEELLKMHFGEVEYEVLGQRRTRPRRTTTTNEAGERDVLNTEEMAKYFDFVMRKAGELGLYIEDPVPHLRTRAA